MKRLTKSPDVTQEKVNDFLYLCDAGKRQVYVLNHYASVVWDRLDGADDLENVVSRLRVEFEDPSGVLETDVLSLVSDLESRGLLLASSS
jgi:Coenzyme PQQ synthesis protein D (PqqD)